MPKKRMNWLIGEMENLKSKKTKNQGTGNFGEKAILARLKRDAGPGGIVKDMRKTKAGYDYYSETRDPLTGKVEIKYHEIKTKSPGAKTYPQLTPNEERARKKYGDDYVIDYVDSPEDDDGDYYVDLSPYIEEDDEEDEYEGEENHESHQTRNGKRFLGMF